MTRTAAYTYPTNPIDAYRRSTSRFHVLLVTSSPLDDPSRISPVREIEEVYRQLQFVKVPAAIIRLNPPTLHYLRSTLLVCNFDVVHFIGHARKDAIQLEKEDGTADWVSVDDLASLFEATALKLVILNNCSSENLGDSLILEGVPAVISTSNRIHSDTSLLLTASIYSAIFRGQTIEAAVAAINRTIRREKHLGQPRIIASGSGVNQTVGQASDDSGEPEFYQCVPINNLPPVSRDGFYDRVDESLRVYDSLTRTASSSPYVGITGLAGSGKSAVALSCAWRYGWRFPKGIAYVSLRQKPFNVEAFVRHFGWSFDDIPLDRILNAVVYELALGQYLLVFDDFESADPEDLQIVSQLLQGWDTSLGGRAILIMRQRRPEMDPLIQTNWVSIGDLPDDASIELFQFHVGGSVIARRRVGEDLERIPDLCFRHPKLIQATASALISGKPWQEIVTRLGHLVGDPAERSIEMLEKTIEQVQVEVPLVIHFLDSWSAFAESATESAWRFVVQGESLDARDPRWFLQGDALEMMQRVNILERYDVAGQVLCKMHPLVSEYIHKRRWQTLSPEKQKKYENSHLRYYILECSTIKSDEYPIVREWGNILLALDRARSSGKWEGVASLCDSIVGSDSHQLIKRGPWDYAKKALEYGIQAAQQTNNSMLLIAFLLNSGIIGYRLSEYEDSRNSYADAFRLAEESECIDFAIDAMKGLGQVFYRLGDYDQAETTYRSSLDMARSKQDIKRIANIQHQLGKVAYRQQDLTMAEDLFRSVLEIRQEIADERGVSKTLHEIARVMHAAGRYTESEELYNRSLSLRIDVNDPVGQQATLHQLGVLAFDQGDYETAKRYYSESMAISHALNDRLWIAHNLFRNGCLLWRSGNQDEASQSVSEALAICQKLGIGLRAEIDTWLQSPK